MDARLLSASSPPNPALRLPCDVDSWTCHLYIAYSRSAVVWVPLSRCRPGSRIQLPVSLLEVIYSCLSTFSLVCACASASCYAARDTEGIITWIWTCSVCSCSQLAVDFTTRFHDQPIYIHRSNQSSTRPLTSTVNRQSLSASDLKMHLSNVLSPLVWGVAVSTTMAVADADFLQVRRHNPSNYNEQPAAPEQYFCKLCYVSIQSSACFIGLFVPKPASLIIAYS